MQWHVNANGSFMAFFFVECLASTQLKIEWEKNERNEEFEMNHEAIWKEYFSIFLYNQIFVVARSFMMKMNRVEITFFYNKRPNSYCPSLLLFSIFFFGHSNRIEIKDLQRMEWVDETKKIDSKCMHNSKMLKWKKISSPNHARCKIELINARIVLILFFHSSIFFIISFRNVEWK